MRSVELIPIYIEIMAPTISDASDGTGAEVIASTIRAAGIGPSTRDRIKIRMVSRVSFKRRLPYGRKDSLKGRTPATLQRDQVEAARISDLV